jgi:signal transduction histidine kinase
MTWRPHLPTLPLRRWLAIALVTTFVVPAMVTGITFGRLVGEPNDALDQAEEQLRTEPDRWTDPAWQAATGAAFAERGVAFAVVVDGREVYRSQSDLLPTTGDESGEVTIRRLQAAGGASAPVAYLSSAEQEWRWGDPGQGGPPEDRPYFLIPLAFTTTLLLTLGVIALFLGRTVVRPLAAAGHAAHAIADGDLDVTLPSSRVREVAELKTAFESMSAGLKASIEQQAEMEQGRRLFIGAIVHDLRTPLFSLRGYLEGLATGVADTPEKRASYVATAREKAAALERLISDLFDYTRLEYLDQGFEPPSREPLDLGALLRRLVDGLQPQAAAKRIRLTLDEPVTPCTVQGDAHLLSRAVENLLDNALRYTPSGGVVRVACHPAPSGVAFTVADTGPGIPTADLPHLFTPLYRGEDSRNRRTGGAGLGLTIARRILLAHGGDLVAGNTPTGGAVFTASLPQS